MKPGTESVRGPTRHSPRPNQEKYMKRLALVAVVLVAACSTKETPKADTAAPAMAPAPAPAVAADTGMKKDTAKAKRDTAAKKVEEAKGAVKDAAKATKKP